MKYFNCPMSSSLFSSFQGNTKCESSFFADTCTLCVPIFIEIITAVGKNIIVGLIYRPPNNKIDLFENNVNNILGKIDKENKICYLMGDFNIDLLKSESCDYTNRFLEQLFTSSYMPLILRPTRITHHTATCTNRQYFY